MTANTAQRVAVERLRELLAKATPGPWTTGEGDPESILSEHNYCCIAQANTVFVDVAAANAALIAEGISALPALLLQVAELEAWKSDHQKFLLRLSVALVIDGNCKQDTVEQCVTELTAKLAEQAAEIDRAAVLAEGREATIRLMRREIEAAERDREEAQEEAATERALQRAARELPIGWEIRVTIEPGAGWVELWDPRGNETGFSDDGSIAEHVNAAVSAAFLAANGGKDGNV